MKCMHCGEESTEENEGDFSHEHPKICPNHDDVSVADAVGNYIRWKEGNSPWPGSQDG